MQGKVIPMWLAWARTGLEGSGGVSDDLLTGLHMDALAVFV